MPILDIVKDPDLLSTKSDKIIKGDDLQQLIQDLTDTANHHIDNCLGLSGIQIGYSKRICVIKSGEKTWLPLINPVIVKRSPATYLSEEGCLSFEGKTNTVKRHNQITIMHEVNGKIRKLSFSGIHSVIVQHEIDHMNGRLI